MTDRKAADRVNVSGTAQVIHDCWTADIKHLVYLSSTTVYGARSGAEQPYTEESPVRPVRGFQYAENKAAAELKLRTFAMNNPNSRVTILRGVHGNGAPSARTSLLMSFSDWRAYAFSVPIRRCSLSISTTCSTLFELCLLKPACGVFNITGEGDRCL